MIDRKPNNPYQYTTAVQKAEMFFGRTHILRRIYSAIDSKQSISLVGSRRIGKSSILTCMLLPEIQEEFEFDFSRHIFISLDMAEFRFSNCSDFFLQVSKQILDKAQRVMGDLEREPQGEQDDFAELLSEIKDHQFHLVLLMDSFDNATRNEKFDADFFIFLRSQWRKVSYVTASTVQLSKVSHQQIQDSPFFNIFSQCSVGALASDDAYRMVTEPAARVGLPFTDGEVRWLVTEAGLHPFFLHYACRILFDEKCSQDAAAINLKAQEQKIYDSLVGDFEDVWKHLEERQQDGLRQEIQRKSTSPSMLEFSSSKLFQRFIRARSNMRIFELTVEELEVALEKLDDMRELGNSVLNHLTSVSQRASSDASVVQKGMIIRDILRKAHERMRGSGLRADNSFDWRLYNILYYRYFKQHLRHDIIATHLEFTSTRQYFRERSKALEKLLNELLEMEAELDQQA